MLHIVINKQRYPLPASWQELDLQQARCLIRCSQLLNTSHPDRSDNCPEKDKVTISLLVELCRIPRHIASHTQPQERLIFARRVLYKLGSPAGYTTDQNQADHTDILSGQTAHPPRFHWQGEWLRYPETDRDNRGGVLRSNGPLSGRRMGLCTPDHGYPLPARGRTLRRATSPAQG